MENLRRRLFERASIRGLELSQEECKRVLRDIKRWLPDTPPSDNEVVVTADGSYTLISSEYGESYHSLTAGALTEAAQKFVKPSGLIESAQFMERVAILDIGFGLGYNVAVAVHKLRKVNKSIEVEIITLDKAIPENIPALPEPYRETHKKVLSLLPNGEREGVSLKLYKGDMRKTLKVIKGFRADAVFYDPFSPYRNPEAWTLELLNMVKGLMKDTGVWVSYTSSLPVRRALLDLGFKIGETPAVGRKKGGTIASLKKHVGDIRGRDRIKLYSSPYSVPFRDENLELEPVDILIDYRLSVLLRERAVSSELGRELQQARPS
ncbi:chorismate dehydratase [Hydrogenivirga caldilitoris]|uniref:Chorismate dehydratase n=2 Tax=Hydrogenivirga caldilitoris TaxID=246264 RepID=A0A497XLY7_9AQUI|nr:chorismate dehydratase [Hydrogenivirga caldilitoris]